jgi:hypothetical protein
MLLMDRNDDRPGLDQSQRAIVDTWFPGATLVADHGWGVVDSVVLQLHVGRGHQDVIVKAGGPSNHHIDRELTAHELFVAPLAADGTGTSLAPW